MVLKMRSRDPVPLVDPKAQWVALRGEITAAVARVLERQDFIFGPELGDDSQQDQVAETLHRVLS